MKNFLKKAIVALLVVLLMGIGVAYVLKGRAYNLLAAQKRVVEAEVLNHIEAENTLYLSYSVNSLYPDQKLPEETVFVSGDLTDVQCKSLCIPQKLVFRFSPQNCMKCVEHEMKLLNTYADSIGVDNIIVVSGYSNHQHLNYIVEDINPQYQCYNDPVYLSKLPYERCNMSYFMVVDYDLNVRDVFFPTESNDDITLKYLRQINNRYFN